MKCSKCGKEFEGNFCPNCGEPANSVENPSTEHENWNNWKPIPSQPQRFPAYKNPSIWNNSRRKKFSPSQVIGVVFGSIFLLFALIVVIAIMTPSGNDNAVAAGTNSVEQKENSESLKEEAITVDYKALYKDYEDNAINADKKYRDKKLILTGTIANIDRDIAQNPYVTFNIDEYGAKSIKMSFGNDDTVAALKKGQKVTVVGTCGGTFASTIITLNGCSLMK
ncbi:OB-fold protein [Caproiciproducens sp. R2]|uniref:OB-fold protein n=1 Tax=Caproiciproducens sp. R2 TaxID=3435187 RepID=UPI0040340385